MSYTPSSSSPSSVTITAAYSGDSSHLASSGTSQLTINILHTTTVAVGSSVTSFVHGGTVTFNATVTDTSSSPSTLSGQILWNDNHAGGSFIPDSCTISSGACSTSYTSAINSPDTITITAEYSGDGTHALSTGTVHLSTASNLTSTTTLDNTTTTVSTSSGSFTAGNPITVTATVTDNSNPSANLLGVISWNDNGAGGSFSPNQCLLSGNHCALQYTPPSNPSDNITITADYGGDSTHPSSSGKATISIAVQPVTTQPSPTPQSTPSPTPQSTPSPTPQSTPSPTPQSTPSPTPQSTPSPTQDNTQTTPSTTQSSIVVQPPQTSSLPKQSTTNTPNTHPAPSIQSSSTTGQPASKSTQTTPTSTQSTSARGQQQANTGTVINEIEQLPQTIINIIESFFHQI